MSRIGMPYRSFLLGSQAVTGFGAGGYPPRPRYPDACRRLLSRLFDDSRIDRCANRA